MYSKELMLLTYLGILGGCRLISTSTTTTLVSAMSLANQDLERYFRQVNASHAYAQVNEERIAMDYYHYAFLNYSYWQGLELSSVAFEEEQARYGEGVIASVTGKLVHITDEKDITNDSACNPEITGTRGYPLPPKGVAWIALVRRGSCKFEDKVKHVANKGAAAVIVFNDKPVLVLEKMQIKHPNRKIAAVLTYQHIGAGMIELLNGDIDVNVTITEGKSGVRPVNTLNRTSVLFVSVSFIVLMIVSLVWLIFYYIQRFRYLQAKDQQSRNLCSVTKKAIMKIPTKTGKSTDEKDADSDCCAICIEAYKASDVIRILPCKHEFHKSCIDPWLIEHRTCPMCKLDVLKFYGYVVGDQINQNPSPQHQAPNVIPVGVNDVPILVVSIAPPQQQQPPNHNHQQEHQAQQQQPQPQQNESLANSFTSSANNTNNFNNSSSSSNNSNSNASTNQNFSQSCTCSTSAGQCSQCRNVLTSGAVMSVPTASRQVTDV